MVDTLNVREEKLPDFDQEAIGAKYKGGPYADGGRHDVGREREGGRENRAWSS